MKSKLLIKKYLLIIFLGFSVLRANDLAVSLEAFKITRGVAGAELLVMAEQAAPGELIEYRAVYKNMTSNAMSGIFAEIPVPNGLIWAASSDQPKAAEVRLADGRLVALPFVDENGQPLASELVRAVRWKIDRISAGESVVVSLRATVAR